MFDPIDIEFNDNKDINWNGRHEVFRRAFIDFYAERIDSGKKITYSNLDEYNNLMESMYEFIQDALVKHAIQFGDEYALECYGLLPVDIAKINELISQRDKHALTFFGLEKATEDELRNWDAKNLERLPLVKDFEESFTPTQPLYDKWNIYYADYD